MIKKCVSVLLAIMMTIGLLSVNLVNADAVVLGYSDADFSGGEGTESNPYRISNYQQLLSVEQYCDKHFILTQNIDFSNYNGGLWDGLCDENNPFSGSFDGNGHTIKNIKFNSIDTGFFTCVNNCVIKNLNIESTGISTEYVYSEPENTNNHYFGIVIGKCTSDSVVSLNNINIDTDLVITINSKKGDYHRYYIGGAIGFGGKEVDIQNSSYKGNITYSSSVTYSESFHYAGGFVGRAQSFVGDNLTYNGNIKTIVSDTANTTYTGGFAASLSKIDLDNCSFYGNVLGECRNESYLEDVRTVRYSGGICADVTTSKINNTEVVGNVYNDSNYGSAWVGGFFGHSGSSNFDTCSYKGIITNYALIIGSKAYAGGFIGESIDVISDNCIVDCTINNRGYYSGVISSGGLVGLTEKCDITALSINSTIVPTAYDTASAYAYSGGVIGSCRYHSNNLFRFADINVDCNIDDTSKGLSSKSSGLLIGHIGVIDDDKIVLSGFIILNGNQKDYGWDTSLNNIFSLTGEQFYLLGKEGTLSVSYESSEEGQVLTELKYISWTNSNPDIATVSGLENGIADIGNNKVSVMVTVNATNVGSTTIEGTSPDGRKASFTINVEPEIKANKGKTIIKETDFSVFNVSLNKANKPYLESFAKSIKTSYSYNEGLESITVSGPTVSISDDGLSASIDYHLNPQWGGSVSFIAESSNGQKVECVVNSGMDDYPWWDYKDEWSFKNYILDKITLTASDYNALIEGQSEKVVATINSYLETMGTRGMCYGMSFASLVVKRNILSLNNIDDSISSLYDAQFDEKSKSIIGYHHIFQKDSEFRDLANEWKKYTDKQKLQIISNLNYGLLVFDWFDEKNCSHAVVVLGKEDGNWIKNNRSYDKRIKIYDPNYPAYFNDSIRENSYLFYNSNSFEWTIPNYKNANSYENGYLEYAFDDDYHLNLHNLQLGKEGIQNIVRLRDDNQYSVVASNGERFSIEDGNYSSNDLYYVYSDIGYNPDAEYSYMNIEFDPRYSYEITPTNKQIGLFSVENDNYFLSTECCSLTSITVSNNACSVNGIESDYQIDLTTDKNRCKYSTYSLTGNNSDISIELTESGVSVEGDDLSDITITGKNQTNDESETMNISEGDNSVQIINQNEVFDLLGNMVVGDVDFDGSVSIIDATYIQRELVDIPIPFAINDVVGDVDGDSSVSIIDVTLIQRYLVGIIDHFYQPEELSLNAAEKTLSVGDVFTLLPTIKPDDATNKSIIWSSSDNSIATVTNGVVTAIASGTATITAKTCNGKSAKCKIFVKPIEVTSISFNDDNIYLLPNDTYQITAFIEPFNALDKSITWSSNNTTVATVDSNGIVVAKKPGTATIIAKTSNNKSTSCLVTVLPIEVISVSLNTNSVTLTEGETYQLSATISPGNASDKTLTWSSSKESVASVSSTGKVTANSSGTARITVKANNGKNADCVVTVNERVLPERISVLPVRLTLSVGNTYDLNATISPDSAYDKTITWSSSNSNAVSVNPNGRLTANKAGMNAVITAKTVNGITSTVTVDTVQNSKENLEILKKASQTADKQYWVVFNEGYRDNRVEMSSFDANQGFKVTWDMGISCDNQIGECTQYMYNEETKEFVKIGTYSKLTDYATKILGSNCSIYDNGENKIISPTNFQSQSCWELGVKYNDTVYSAPVSQGPTYMSSSGDDLYYILNLDSELYQGAALTLYITSGSSGSYSTYSTVLSSNTYDNKTHKGYIPISQYLNNHKGQYIRVYTEVALTNKQVVKPANLGTDDAIYLYIN